MSEIISIKTDKTYNGWTNYATWRVNLEVFDGMDIRDTFPRRPEIYDVVEYLESWMDEVLESYVPSRRGESNLVLDYARSFLSDVDYVEIAEHLIDAAEYEDEDEE